MAYESFAQVYDRLMADMPYDRWLSFLLDCIARNESASDRAGVVRTVVDLGCGTGNLAIPLARAGFDVIGIDRSPDMLSLTEHKRSPSDALQLLQMDMCELALTEPVDVIFSFCDSINYVTEELAVRGLFERVHQYLRPGGLFVFDVHSAATFKTYAEQQPFVLNEPDLAYIWTCEFESPLIEHHLTIFVADHDQARYRRIEEWHVQRVWPSEWLQSELQAAGFRDVQLFTDFSFAPATDETNRVFVYAIK